MKIQIPNQIEKKIRKALVKARDKEIGGLLFAEQIAPGSFHLVDVSIDMLSGSQVHFLRDPIKHQSALDDFFDRTGHNYERFNYLGEWHSHPNAPVLPSIHDQATMQNLVDSSEDQIPFAALLICRLNWRFWFEMSMTTFAAGKKPEPVKPSVVFI